MSDFQLSGSPATTSDFGGRAVQLKLTGIQARMLAEAAEHQAESASRAGHAVEQRVWENIAREAHEAADRARLRRGI